MADYVADIVGVLSTATRDGGTGHVIARDRVLTARHTLARRSAGGAAMPPGPAKVYPFLPGTPVHMRGIEATPLWWEPTDLPDAVVLQLHPKDDTHLVPTRPLEIGTLPSDSVLDAAASGFPRLTNETVSFNRQLIPIPGEAYTSALDGQSGVATALTIVPKARLNGEPDGWKGLSGAALLSGDSLVGVMREFPMAWDPRQALTAEPIAPLLTRDAFCDAVGLPRGTLARDLRRPVPEVALRDDIAQLSAYLFTLDREDEVRTVGFDLDAASGEPLELLICGHPDDLCHEFWKAVWRRCLRRPGNAPTSIAWPGPGLPNRYWAQALAKDAAGYLFPDQSQPRTLEALGSLLGTGANAPWVCLTLPKTLADPDLRLLAAWRAAWADRRRTDGRAFGYALLHDSHVPPAAGLLLPEGAPGAPRQAHIALRPITLAELAAWDQHLEALAEPPSTSPLPRLARRLRGQLPAGLDTLRLAAVQRLLDGLPPMAPRQPDWAA